MVLAELRAKRAQIDQAIQAIESLRGISPTSAPARARASPKLAMNDTGAYLGMTIADATRKLLAARKRAMGTADIVAGIAAGGLALSSADPINTVSAVLGRRFDKVGDIVRPSRGMWGLKEWDPNRSFKVNKGNGDCSYDRFHRARTAFCAAAERSSGVSSAGEPPHL